MPRLSYASLHPIMQQHVLGDLMDGDDRRTRMSLGVRTDCRSRAFFLHIPKTAGTTLRVFLKNQYPAELVCPIEGWKDLLSVPDYSQYRLFLGHFSANFQKFLPEDIRCFTFLRHPFNRMISILRHMKRDPAFSPLHARAKHLSLSEMLRDDMIMGRNRDGQTALLSARAEPPEVISYIRKKEAAGESWNVASLEGRPSLRRAVETLAGMSFVGILEDFENSLTALCQRMNFHPPLAATSLNRAPGGATDFMQLPEADQQILREHNRLDLILYDLATTLFAKDRQNADSHAVLRHLADIGIYNVPEGPFEIDLSGPVPGSGWYPPETAGGRWWRWTGSGPQFSLEVPLRPMCPYQCILRMMPAAPAVNEWLSVHVNGVETAYQQRPLRGKEIELQFTIPAAPPRADIGICGIVLRHAGVNRPSEQGGSDFRHLGFSVRSVAFAPGSAL
jgi:hypothetical protein